VKAPTARGVAPVGRGHQDRFRRRAVVRTAAASTNNAKPRTATSRGHGVMGLIMMELGPSTPAAKAAVVPLGRLLTPWGSHHGAYDVNRLVTCAKGWPSSELATPGGGGHWPTYVVRAEALRGRLMRQRPASSCETGPCRATGRSRREGTPDRPVCLGSAPILCPLPSRYRYIRDARRADQGAASDGVTVGPRSSSCPARGNPYRRRRGARSCTLPCLGGRRRVPAT
jgi:hypothetical protein